jgi:hypothetical protein
LSKIAENCDQKNANFFAENWEKSPKIVIITSTPGPNSPPQVFGDEQKPDWLG